MNKGIEQAIEWVKGDRLSEKPAIVLGNRLKDPDLWIAIIQRFSSLAAKDLVGIHDFTNEQLLYICDAIDKARNLETLKAVVQSGKLTDEQLTKFCVKTRGRSDAITIWFEIAKKIDLQQFTAEQLVSLGKEAHTPSMIIKIIGLKAISRC